MTNSDSATKTALEMLGPLGQRWAHVQGVAQRAAVLTLDLSNQERDLVVTAAWLHDIGYAPQLARSRFHPLDGARYVHAVGFPLVVVGLVAYHSGAVIEAHERGLGSELAAFVAPPDLLLRRLTASDMTTSPTGYPVQASERVEEILRRYPPQDPVHQAIRLSGSSLIDIANAEDARARIGQVHQVATDHYW
ncbi:HD domain-containing protein [Pengzhenrongella frigida]|nr:HD domain-containing protein [Cellulomonas sp. HLT2-17]